MSGLFLVLLFCAESGNADSPVRELSAVLDQLDHFSAEFNQVTYDANGDEIQHSSGRLWITKPLKFRSHTDPPMEQVLVSDGELLWYYDPDLEQVTVQKLELLSDNQPALLLAGQLEDISSHFRVDYYADDIGEHYVLIPSEKDGSVTSLVLTVSDANISKIDVNDALGQRTTIAFSSVEKNIQIDPATYHFNIPEGVDVVKEY